MNHHQRMPLINEPPLRFYKIVSSLSFARAGAMCVSFILIYALLFSFFFLVVAPCRISPDSVTTLKELLIGKARVRERERERERERQKELTNINWTCFGSFDYKRVERHESHVRTTYGPLMREKQLSTSEEGISAFDFVF